MRFFLMTLALFSLLRASPGAAAEVPASLQAIEGKAEDVLDLADARPKAPDWKAVARDVKKIGRAWKEYKKDNPTQLLTSPRLFSGMDRALEALERASRLKSSPVRLKQSANAVGAYAADLFDLFDPKVPADINRLDVMENQVLIDLDINRGNLTMDIQTIKGIWGKAGPKVKDKPGGADAAGRFEAALAAQEKAVGTGDWKKLEQDCRRELEVIDDMEKVF
jgi:hypothetical protein